jgi:hypothetical protein
MLTHMTAAAVLMFAPAAFAQTYIVPDRDCGAATLRIEHASADAASSASRIATAYLFVPHRRIALQQATPFTFQANLPEDAVAMAGVEFQPETVGNETRTAHAKALIFCAATPPPADWQRSADLGLEIYPQGWNGPRPSLKAGDPVRFIVVDKASKNLLRDLPMELRRVGGEVVSKGQPASGGGMNFRCPAPGWYVVTATYRRADPGRTDHWLVDSSTLTFEIK